MKSLFCFIAAVLICGILSAQKVSFKKDSLKIKEPFDKDNLIEQEKSFGIVLLLNKIPTKPFKAAIDIVKKDSKYDTSRISLESRDSLLLNREENIYKIKIKTWLSDENGYVIFKVGFKDSTGEQQLLKDTLFIQNTFPFQAKSKDSLKSSKNFEPWIFTGTNIDLLDGPKASELYLKLNFLTRVSDCIYLQFGAYKSRNFLTSNDSDRVSYHDEFYTQQNLNNQTVTIVNGVASQKTTSISEPLGIYLEGLGSLFKTENLSIFGIAGFELGQVKTTIKYELSNLITDTIIKPSPGISPYQFRQTKIEFTSPNYYMYGGLFLIYDDDGYNVKAHFIAGMNHFNRLVYISKDGVYHFNDERPLFVGLKFSGVIKSPGIGIGFEAMLRNKRPVSMNFTLSKVIDFKNITAIFSPVSSIK